MARIKLSTIAYVIAAILFALAALALGKEYPTVDLGLVATAIGLALGSIGS